MRHEIAVRRTEQMTTPQSGITVRAPLRIPLGGGGTDLPSYWKGRGGFFISGAINRYVTVSLAPPYGETNGEVDRFIDNVLDLAGAGGRRISWASDVPSGSGLGFSSALVVAIVYAIRLENGQPHRRDLIARQAYQIERALRPVGCQDHYAAAFGGVIACEISPAGIVNVRSLLHGSSQRWSPWFRLYHTGLRRQAAEVLKLQDAAADKGDPHVITCLREIEGIGEASLNALRRDDRELFGALTARHWEIKKRMSPKATNRTIDRLCSEVVNACGVKLIGAGGGGCLLCVNSAKRPALIRGLRRIPFMWGKGVHRLHKLHEPQ